MRAIRYILGGILYLIAAAFAFILLTTIFVFQVTGGITAAVSMMFFYWLAKAVWPPKPLTTTPEGRNVLREAEMEVKGRELQDLLNKTNDRINRAVSKKD